MNDRYTLYKGDCLDHMAEMLSESVDSIVTDPPYGLKFMGKDWDHGVPGEHFWREAFRVAKPGAHLLAFGGTRTYHRLVCAIEDAGWEIRDTIMWVYGSGFPKSLDVSKAIDKAAGAENVIGYVPDRWTGKGGVLNFATDRAQSQCKVTAPASDAAREWHGWGTALKPAFEPIVLARKPLAGRVDQNVIEYGTGALNIDGCRVSGVDGDGHWSADDGSDATSHPGYGGFTAGGRKSDLGRWPANIIHDGSDVVVAMFPDAPGQSGATGPQYGARASVNAYGDYGPRPDTQPRDDAGSASRFFYCAKADKEDRDSGLEELAMCSPGECTDRQEDTAGLNNPRAGAGRTSGHRNNHPTVKPNALMRYLCRLVTPPDGLILDMFMGSGSTGKAALMEGFRFIGCEKESHYLDIARRRISKAASSPRLFTVEDEICIAVKANEQLSLFG